MADKKVGFWWLPASTEEKKTGTLLLDADAQLTLELVGAFDNNILSGGISDYPMIHGITQGSLLSLTQNAVAGQSMSFPGFSSQKILVGSAYQGVHFTSPDEMRFNKMYVSYSHLPEWLNISGFTEALNNSSHSITYSTPENDFKVEDEQFHLTLFFGYSTNTGNRLRHMSVEQHVSFLIEVQSELSHQEWHTHYIYPLQNFLTFATLKPNFITKLSFFSPRFAKGDYQIPIEVLLESNDTEMELLHRTEMLFDYNDIKPDSSILMRKWLQIAQELDSVCHLFLGTQYRSPLLLEQKFLSVAQAIESFHRRRRKNKRWSTKEFRRRRDEVISQVEAEHKDWVTTLTNYANEPSFSDRVRELLKETNDVVEPLIADQDKFIELVKDTRNYYVHWNESLQDKTPTGERLLRATQILVFMLQTLLLADMGVKNQQAKELITKTREYRYLVEQQIMI